LGPRLAQVRSSGENGRKPARWRDDGARLVAGLDWRRMAEHVRLLLQIPHLRLRTLAHLRDALTKIKGQLAAIPSIARERVHFLVDMAATHLIARE